MSKKPLAPDIAIIRSGLLFLVVGGVLFASVTLACWVLLPKEPMTMVSMDAMTTDQKQPKNRFWKQFKRWLDGMKGKAEGKRFVKRDSTSGSKLNVTQGKHVPSTLTSQRQLILRQMIIAEQQLASVQGKSPDAVLKRLSIPNDNSPWQSYELQRLHVRVLGEIYEVNHNRDVLMQYTKTATSAADSRFSNFEDYFNAGHANLFAGNIQRAHKYLIKAERSWPVKRDTVLGLNNLMIIMCDAVSNKQDAFFARLATLQEHFPDWMFTEVYLPDIERLGKLHPRARLLNVLQGRVLDLTYNDTGALKQYKKATGLNGIGRLMVQQWIKDLEERKAK